MIITKQYLIDNPTHIFVYGDNLLRRSYGGAAKLRDMPNSYGFVTKKAPTNYHHDYYKPLFYKDVFNVQLSNLTGDIESNPNSIFLISKLGSGLANKYNIWELVIKEGLEILRKFNNVKFLWKI